MNEMVTSVDGHCLIVSDSPDRPPSPNGYSAYGFPSTGWSYLVVCQSCGLRRTVPAPFGRVVGVTDRMVAMDVAEKAVGRWKGIRCEDAAGLVLAEDVMDS